MNIVAITRSHNSSLCLLKDGEVEHHIENERLSRIKYDNICFDAIYKLPNYINKVDRICITGMSVSPKTDVANTNPVYADAIFRLGKSFNQKTLINENFLDHHYHHACCAFYNSGFEKALCIILDGNGSPYVLHGDNRKVYYGREDNHVGF